MPELAEVEYFRQRWDAGIGAKILAVRVHAQKRIFRGTDPAELSAALQSARLLGSEARGKQMLFRFSGGAWIGLHLGMTGALREEDADFTPDRHDHLLLAQKARALVFRDARMFGRVRFHRGKQPPTWWTELPPALTSPQFTLARLRGHLRRRKGSPLKAVLLDQALFAGVGNWMADEILWQARLHPRALAGDLDAAQSRALWKKTRAICRTALRTIGKDWSDPPANWLLHVRWKRGGHCPRDGTELEQATVAGRTTVWCERCQKSR